MEPADGAPAAKRLRSRGLRLYRVAKTPWPSLAGLGIYPGDLLQVDETPKRVAALQDRDVVLVHIVDPGDGVANDVPVDAVVLRQFIAPNVLITNRGRGNDAIHKCTDTFVHSIVGVVVPQSA